MNIVNAGGSGEPWKPTFGKTNATSPTLNELLMPGSADEFIAVTLEMPNGLGAEDGGKLENLNDFLKDAQMDGKKPATSAVALVPAGPTASEMQSLNDIRLLSTFANAYAFLMMYKAHPDPYELSTKKGAYEFTQDAANYLNYAITKGMGTFLTIASSKDLTMNEKVTTASLHAAFLGKIFDSFSLPAEALKALDGVLSAIFKNLEDIEVGISSKGDTLNHLLFVYYFDDVQGLSIKQAKLRIFYLHIDDSTWETVVKVGKLSAGAKHFAFNMSYVDISFDMNPEMVEAEREKIMGLVQKFTARSFESISDLCSPKVVKDK